MSTKICKKCGVEKPIESFRVQSSCKNRRGECKKCESARHHQNPVKHNATRRNRMYGITDEQYKAMLLAQSGACAICGGSKKLSVDHCHNTGLFRGILCFHCNTAIGHLGDSFSRVIKAASYLRKFSSSFLS